MTGDWKPDLPVVDGQSMSLNLGLFGQLQFREQNSSVFDRPNKPSQAALPGQHALRDIERVSFALCIRGSQPWQR